jgi:hypothetical protein
MYFTHGAECRADTLHLPCTNPEVPQTEVKCDSTSRLTADTYENITTTGFIYLAAR